jgi:hypothetical protein
VRRARSEAWQPVLEPARKPLVHRALFLAPLDGTDQHKRLHAIRAPALLGLDPVAHGLPVVRVRDRPAHFLSSLFGVPTR